MHGGGVMEHSITIAQALGLAGGLVSILLTVVGLLLGILFKQIMAKLTDLATSDAAMAVQFQNLKDSMPREYIPRHEYDARHKAIEERLNELRELLERIYDKLDRKADK